MISAGKRRPLLRLFIIGGCLIALIWTVHSLGPSQVLGAARGADPLWLALSVPAVVARFLIWSVKWTRLLRRQADVPYAVALRILTAGSFVNVTTPTAKLAGGLLRAALLERRYGWGLAVAYGRALADQVTNLLGTLTLFGLLAVAAWLSVPGLVGGAALLGSGIVVLAAVALVTALRGLAWEHLRRPAVGRRLARWAPERLRGSADERLRAVFFPLLGERSVWTTLVPEIGLSVLSFASLCLASALVLRALGVEAEVWLLAVAVVVGYFAGVAVGAGGIGVTEAALTGLYIQCGVAPSNATAAALLHRASYYAVVLAWGGLSLMREGRHSANKASTPV